MDSGAPKNDMNRWSESGSSPTYKDIGKSAGLQWTYLNIFADTWLEMIRPWHLWTVAWCALPDALLAIYGDHAQVKHDALTWNLLQVLEDSTWLSYKTALGAYKLLGPVQ